MTVPSMPRLLSPEWMRAYLIRFCRPRSLVWSCQMPNESVDEYEQRMADECPEELRAGIRRAVALWREAGVA